MGTATPTGTPTATPTAGAAYGSWNEWTFCSSTCDGGKRTRTRECAKGDCTSLDGEFYEQADCNSQACPEGAPTQAQCLLAKKCKLDGCKKTESGACDVDPNWVKPDPQCHTLSPEKCTKSPDCFIRESGVCVDPTGTDITEQEIIDELIKYCAANRKCQDNMCIEYEEKCRALIDLTEEEKEAALNAQCAAAKKCKDPCMMYDGECIHSSTIDLTEEDKYCMGLGKKCKDDNDPPKCKKDNGVCVPFEFDLAEHCRTNRKCKDNRCKMEGDVCVPGELTLADICAAARKCHKVDECKTNDEGDCVPGEMTQADICREAKKCHKEPGCVTVDGVCVPGEEQPLTQAEICAAAKKCHKTEGCITTDEGCVPGTPGSEAPQDPCAGAKKEKKCPTEFCDWNNEAAEGEECTLKDNAL